MTNDWSARVAAAQRKPTCWKNGMKLERIRYGNEKDECGASNHPCGDCGVEKGQYHLPGCDIERCPSCGDQMIGCDCASSRLSKKSPKPFSKRELGIVAARRLFRWRFLRFTENGNAIFEVSNGSTMTLSYLSIRVESTGETKLVGGAWLNISAIGPGQAGQVEHQCYKETLLPEEQEFVNTPEPTPETRDRFWEFKRISTKK